MGVIGVIVVVLWPCTVAALLTYGGMLGVTYRPLLTIAALLAYGDMFVVTYRPLITLLTILLLFLHYWSLWPCER